MLPYTESALESHLCQIITRLPNISHAASIRPLQQDILEQHAPVPLPHIIEGAWFRKEMTM